MTIVYMIIATGRKEEDPQGSGGSGWGQVGRVQNTSECDGLCAEFAQKKPEDRRENVAKEKIKWVSTGSNLGKFQIRIIA